MHDRDTRSAQRQTPTRGVVGVLVRGGRVLVIRRAQSVVAPGAFCFPGGAIEEGETEPEALVRELTEELGVEVRPQRRIWQSVTPWQVELSWWLAELVHECRFRPNPQEVESYAWFTLDQLATLPNLLASNLQFLAAVRSGEVLLPLNTAEPNGE